MVDSGDSRGEGVLRAGETGVDAYKGGNEAIGGGE